MRFNCLFSLVIAGLTKQCFLRDLGISHLNNLILSNRGMNFQGNEF